VKLGILETSISARLTGMLAVVTLVVFAAVGGLLHWRLERELVLEERLDLESKVDVVQHFIDEVHSMDDLAALRRHLDVARIGRLSWRVWIVAADGRVLYGGPDVPVSRPATGGRISIVREDGVTLTGLGYGLRAGPVLPAARVLIGVDPRSRQRLMRAYDEVTAFVCALGVAATVLLSTWVARRGLRPLRELSGEAAGIGAGALSRRLSAQHHSRELAPLVHSFNHALDRVEEAYRQLEGFGADVAHELRTPLTILISGTEVALSRERPADELRDLLASHLEDLRGLAGLINDMLFLAQSERGKLAEKLPAVSLRTQAQGVADYLEALIVDSHLQLRVDGDARAHANPSLVRRALVNLVGNAARYTPDGETIVIRLDEADGAARVSVSNPGPPIPDVVRARMFDRFWRGDASRARSTERTGLGLSIVRAVARMHGGDTFVCSRAGTNTVGFTLGAVA
jgi:two-component system heavy metal sensor histidine kinase CusS